MPLAKSNPLDRLPSGSVRTTQGHQVGPLGLKIASPDLVGFFLLGVVTSCCFSVHQGDDVNGSPVGAESRASRGRTG